MDTPKGRIATPFYFSESETTYYLLLLQTQHQPHHHFGCYFELVVYQLVVEQLEQVFEQLLQALEV